MPADDLNSKIKEQEASITAAEKDSACAVRGAQLRSCFSRPLCQEVDELLKSMQKEYEEAKIAKETAFPAAARLVSYGMPPPHMQLTQVIAREARLNPCMVFRRTGCKRSRIQALVS